MHFFIGTQINIHTSVCSVLSSVLNTKHKMIVKTLCHGLADQYKETDKQITIIKMWNGFIRHLFHYVRKQQWIILFYI